MKNKKKNAIIKWFEDVAALIKNNKTISIAILSFILVIIVAIIVVNIRKEDEVVQEELVVETEVGSEYVITDEALEVDAYPQINDLMRQYYDAAAAGDTVTIDKLRTAVDEKEKIVIQKRSEYVESYPVVTCYTKKGPIEDSFLVFAYYEVKLFDYDAVAPGLNAWYVCKREDGSYYINDDEQDEKLTDYCKIISVQDDVVDLNNTVNVKFNEAMTADEEFASFLSLLPELLTASVGEELANANEPQEQEVTDDDSTEQVAQGEDTTNTEGEPKEAKTTDVVNIRSSDSETADRVGKAQKGDKFKVLEQKVNGWTKILYEGNECYIKSEYLQIIGEETASNASTTTDTVSDEQALADSPSSGKAKAKDAVNIRESDSTDADKVAMIYKGEEVTVVEKQSNGWTKVKFDGKTGYIKSEYLE